MDECSCVSRRRPWGRAATLGLFTMLAWSQAASALQITVDFRYDTWVSVDPVRRAAIEAAAAEVSRVVTTPLNAIDLTTPAVYQHPVGSSNAELRINGTQASIPEVVTPNDTPYTALAADQYVVFVGSAPLSGPTVAWGGNGWEHGYQVIPQGLANAADFTASLEHVVAQANPNWGRGDAAPNVWGQDWADLLSGVIPGIPPIVSRFGPIFGGVTFDTGENWNPDSLYSTAMHEILHTLGFGTSNLYTDLVSGGEWLGVHARMLNGGSGLGILDNDHLRGNLLSPRITDGVLQTPVMAAYTTGARRELTLMDLAILQDLGYTIIPEPASAAILAGACLLTVARRRGRGLRITSAR